MMNALEDFSTAAPAGPLLPAFGPAVRPAPLYPSFGSALPRRAVLPVQDERPSPPPLNSLSATELRQQVAGDFAGAGDWFSLCRRLRAKGFSLKMRGEDLWIHDAASRAALASCGELGIDLTEAELRFGPPQPKRTAA